jgi:hypothetical protein
MAPWDPSYPSQSNLFDLVRASAWAPPNLPLFRPSSSQLDSSAENQWQPNALGAMHASNAQFVAPFGGWPLPQAPSKTMSPPTVLAANDQAPTRPWGVPVSPMDVFNPWLRGAIDSLDKTIGHFRSRSGYAEDADSPECRQEWQDARELCAKEFSKPNPSRGITGGHDSIEDCARGHVSERCGGNAYERPRRR